MSKRSERNYTYDRERKVYIHADGHETKTAPYSYNAIQDWKARNKQVVLGIQLSEEERDMVKVIAKSKNMPVSGLVRKYIIEAFSDEIE